MAPPLKRVRNLPPGVIEEMIDRRRRIVHLRAERMRHIVEGHPEMDRYEVAIKQAVESSTVRCRGNKSNREVFYARNLGPKAAIAVVVEFKGRKGTVITAHPPRKWPKKADIL